MSRIVGQETVTVDYLSADGNTYTVSVDLSDANVPEGAYLQVEELSDSAAEEYVEEAAKAVNKKVDDLYYSKALDISIIYNNKKIQPDGIVKVDVTLQDKEKEVISEVVHFGDKTEVLKSSTDGNTVQFKTDGFSVFAIVGTTLTAEHMDHNGYKYDVTVTYGPEAKIPEGSTLSVTDIEEGTDAYEYARNAVLADKQAKGEAVFLPEFGFAALDISILNPEGEEIEPAAPVQVDIKIKSLPSVEVLNDVANTIEIQHHVETGNKVVVDTVYDGGATDAKFDVAPNKEIIAEGKAVDPNSYVVNEITNDTEDLSDADEIDASFETELFSTYTISYYYGYLRKNIHYVDTNGNSLTPTMTPNFNARYQYLIYDIEGYEYDSTHIGSRTGNSIQPIVRAESDYGLYYSGNLQYTTGRTDGWGNLQWYNIGNNQEVYVVYKAKTEPTSGGTPQINPDTETWPEGEGAPQFTKSSINNDDNTNTITLSIAAAEKEIQNKTKADVIVVFDVSGSMRYNMEGTSQYDDDRADRINKNARLRIARDAVNAMADTLLGKNTGSNTGANALVRMSLITFSTTATEVRDFTDTPNTFKNSVNALRASGGTNWEQALKLANQKTVRSDAATYIIFVSDGDPTFRLTRGDLTDSDLDLNTSTTYTYYRANNVFGVGNSDGDNARFTVRNYKPAKDVVEDIKSHNKNFYAVGVSSDVTLMKRLVTDANYEEDHYKDGSNATKLAEAFEEIANAISSDLGFGNVQIKDGITELTNMSMKVMQTVDPNSFQYYRYGGKDNKYGTSEANMQEWTSRDADGCAPASYNKETGAVEWNMGSGFQLEDKVTYVVKFRVWPRQDAYDLIADLNNGVKVYELGHENSITAEERAQVVELAAPSIDEEGNHIQGTYTLKTNTDTVEATYNKTTKTGDVVSISSTEDVKATYHPGKIENMDLESMQLTIKKVFEDGLTYQESTGQGEDRPDSVTLVLQRRVGNTYDASADTDFAAYAVGTIGPEITLDESNDWTATIFVAPGLKSGTEILEKGYDFTITEPNINYHYGLIREVINPMVIDGKDEYVGDGQLLDGEQISDYTDRSLTAVNRVKSGIDVQKLVYDTDGTTQIYPDTEFTITGRLLDKKGNPYTWTTGDSEDASGAYDIFVPDPTSSYHYPEHPYTVNGVQYDAYKRTQHKLHFKNTNNFSFTLKAGEFLRFINVPEGTTFEFTETTAGMEEQGYRWSRTDAVTQHRVSAGGDFTTEGDVQPTKFDQKANLASPGVVGDKEYSITYSNKRTIALPKIELVKVAEDTTVKLNGTEFELYNAPRDSEGAERITTNGNGEPLDIKTGDKASSDTAPDGWYSIGELPAGTYYLYETKQPDGYILNETPVIITVTKSETSYSVTATQDGKSVITSNDNIYTITVSNKQKKVGINVIKVDSSNTAKTLENAKFTLTRSDTAGGDFKPYPSTDSNVFITGDNGKFADDILLPVGYYKLTETSAPEYYVLDNTKIVEFQITEKTDGNLEILESSVKNAKLSENKLILTISNDHKTTSLSVTKNITGSMGNKTKKYDFKLTLTLDGTTLTDADWKPTFGTSIEATYNGTSKAWEFTLGDKDVITFSNAPVGAIFVVTEDQADQDGYTTTFFIGETKETVKSATARLTENTELTVTVENKLDSTVPTGIHTDSTIWRWLIGACFLMFFGSVLYGRRKRRQ